MKIGVEEREERELVDRLEVLGPDDARGVPVVELGGKRGAPGVEGSGEVAGEDRAETRGQADGEAAARQAESQARRRHEREPGEGRHGEVVGDERRDPGQLRLGGREEVSPVVVADGLARHPRVGGRHARVAGERVQERQVHELLGAEDRGPRRPDGQQDAGRGPEEDRRELFLVAPPGGPGRGLGGGAPPQEERCAGDRAEREEQRDPPETEGRGERKDPRRVGHGREAQGPAQQGRVAPVAEECAQQREDGEAHQLGRKGPCQNVPHAVRPL